MDAINDANTAKPSSPRFVKTNITNRSKLDPLGTCYGRCKVHGKLVRQSLETKDFKVARTKVRQWLIAVRGRVHAHEGNMGSLIEEYGRRLQLKVASRGIRERTRTTKLECLTEIEKVWEELFTTGNINPANYLTGGDQTKHKPAKCSLFRQVRLSSLTPNTLDEWRAAMCKACSPSRVNGAMTVFGELLKLGVERGMLIQNHDLHGRPGYVRPGKTKLTHLPTAAKFKALIGSKPEGWMGGDLGACVQAGSEFAHKLIGPDSPIYGRWQGYWAQTQAILHQRQSPSRRLRPGVFCYGGQTRWSSAFRRSRPTKMPKHELQRLAFV